MGEKRRNQINEAEKIDLIRMINDMWKGAKRFWLGMILLIVLFGGLFCFRAYRNYSPVYSASATFTINRYESALYANTAQDSKTVSHIVNTFPYILNSGLLQKKVAGDLGMEYVPGEIRTENVGSTNMLTIVVNATTAENAYNILQSVIKHYPEVAEPIIGEVYMNLLDMTDVPERASNEISYRYTAVKGVIAGIAVCVLILLVYAFTRTTVHQESDFKTMLNMDCICAIPRIVFKKREKDVRQDISIYNKKISQNFLEAIRVLRARIEKDAQKNDLKVFLVTSAAPGEGKSTIAANIAMALAMRESKVVLIDCDLRNPSVREQLNLTKEGKGLYEYLTRKAELEEVLKWNAEYQMYILPGGQAISNASELLDSPRMHKLFKHLAEKVEYVILDTAPVGILTDTAVLAQAADAALFVVKQDYASRSAILEGINQLAESGIYFSGCILNGAQAGIGGYGYKNYRYYSKYGNYHSGSHYNETRNDSLQEN